MCGKSQKYLFQVRIIDRAGEFKERNPVRRASLFCAVHGGCSVGDRHDPQANFVDGREVGKATQAREQLWNQESESSRPSGVVDVDSEDLIAYVRDSAL